MRCKSTGKRVVVTLFALAAVGGFLESKTELEKTLNDVCTELRKPKAPHLRDL